MCEYTDMYFLDIASIDLSHRFGLHQCLVVRNGDHGAFVRDAETRYVRDHEDKAYSVEDSLTRYCRWK